MKQEYLNILKEAFASIEADDLYVIDKTHSCIVVAPWASRSVTVTMHGLDDLQNATPQHIVDLFEARAANAARVLGENMKRDGVNALRSDKYRSVKFPDDYIPLREEVAA